MAARGILLTAFAPSILAGEHESFSWGPYSGRLVITSLHFQNNDPTLERTSIGLFRASSPDIARGTNTFVAPPGWTNLTDHADQDDQTFSATVARLFPFQNPSIGIPFVLAGLALSVTGQDFYIKVVVQNRTAGGINFHASMAATLDRTDRGDPIDPRGDGTTDPPPPPPEPVPSPGPPPPPPGGLPDASGDNIPEPLPPPTELTIPQIAIDPVDPIAYIRTRCR